MIIDAIMRMVTIDKDNKRLELFSPKYPEAKALMYLNPSYEGKKVQFITGWEDLSGKRPPFTINGGAIDNKLVGTSTLVRGMCIECNDGIVYIVMDPSLLK